MSAIKRFCCNKLNIYKTKVPKVSLKINEISIKIKVKDSYQYQNYQGLPLHIHYVNQIAGRVAYD